MALVLWSSVLWSSYRLVGVSPALDFVFAAAGLVVNASPNVVAVVAPFDVARAALVFNHVVAFVVEELAGKIREAFVGVPPAVVDKSVSPATLDVTPGPAQPRIAVVFFEGVSKGCGHDTEEDDRRERDTARD